MCRMWQECRAAHSEICMQRQPVLKLPVVVDLNIHENKMTSQEINKNDTVPQQIFLKNELKYSDPYPNVCVTLGSPFFSLVNHFNGRDTFFGIK